MFEVTAPAGEDSDPRERKPGSSQLWITTGFGPAYHNEVKRAGKWMLFLDNSVRDNKGLTRHDRAWIQILKLVEKGIVIGAGSSVEHGRRIGEGVINCYTIDYADIPDVRRVADEIRKVVWIKDAILYKRNVETKAGKFRENGYRDISLYLHTWKGQLLAKNSSKKWVMIDDSGKFIGENPKDSWSRRKGSSKKTSTDMEEDDDDEGDSEYSTDYDDSETDD